MRRWDAAGARIGQTDPSPYFGTARRAPSASSVFERFALKTYSSILILPTTELKASIYPTDSSSLRPVLLGSITVRNNSHHV